MQIFELSEIQEIEEFNESGLNPFPKLSAEQIEALHTGKGMTLGLALMARRLLAEKEIQAKGDSLFLTKMHSPYFASRAELLALEEDFNSMANTLYLLFTALAEKGLLSMEEMQETAFKRHMKTGRSDE